MKIFFLVPYPTGEAPSQRFRFEQYFNLLRENKIEYSVSSFWGMHAWKILYRPGYFFEKSFWILFGLAKRWVDVFWCLTFDRIFIHRECAPVGPPFFEFVISQIFRKKIIYDFDDAIWLENTSRENHIARWIKFHEKVKFICRWSYKISCGNEWLADYTRKYNSNVIVNPTTIDTENLHNPSKWPVPKKDKRIIIGWTGTHSTAIYLESLLPVLREIEKKYPIRIQIISNKNANIDLASAEFIPWSKENEMQQLLAFDIGLMPLTDDDWSRGKCGFKALQYMALAIPCVASPVGVNSSIIENQKNGFLCKTDKEWHETLSALIENINLRKQIGVEGRKKVLESYSVASNSVTFLSLINS
jgi:glycosyltransferase involved in cell wall biosynthesis